MTRPSTRVRLPPPEPLDPLSVQIATRMTPASREAIRQLAEQKGVSLQALGVYAWSLVLDAYGKPPLPEAR
jgi:hypothetical protein